MSREAVQECATHYEVLSQDKIDQLHQNFLNRLHGQAKKAVHALVEDKKSREALVNKVKRLLLLAARQNDKISATELDELIDCGEKVIQKRIHELRVKGREDPWKKYRKQMDKAFRKRTETPLVEKRFEENERIYLKLKNQHEVSDTQLAISIYLSEKDYKITDYIKGYATDKSGKQTFKIGKLLKDDEDLFEKFKNDDTRAVVDKYVVLSRNQQDLESMTEGRNWWSCMNASFFGDKVPPIVGSQTVIAYLITQNDPEINNPLARILLKPYDCRKNVKGIRKEGLISRFMRSVLPSLYEEEPLEESSIILRPCGTYGLGTSLFRDAVTEFAEAHFNKPHKDKEYRLYDYIYQDGSPLKVKLKNNKLSPV